MFPSPFQSKYLTSLKYDRLIKPRNLLAHVTVIDADEGDANIIDFYHADLDGNTNIPESGDNELNDYLLRTTERILIDTGSRRNAISEGICDALLFRTLPHNAFTAALGRAPPLRHLQITHPDIDHIGNVKQIFEFLPVMHYYHPPPSDLRLEYTQIPFASPRMEFYCVGVTEDQVSYTFKLDIDYLYIWIESLRESGLEPVFSLKWNAQICDITYNTASLSPMTIRTPKSPSGFQDISFEIRTDIADVSIRQPYTGEKLDLGSSLRSGEFTADIMSDLISNPPDSQRPRSIGWKQAHGLDDYLAVLEEHLELPYIHYFRPELGKCRTNGSNPWGIRTEQVTMGPTVEAQRRVVRFKLLRHLEAQGDRTIIKFAHREENVERDAINRSSIVTVFRRVDLNFNMLFTGDAHDRDSDIRSRISQYLGQEIRIDVLKIPHHGSNVTTDTGFYHDVRASVYLVCASPSMHGNPRFSTLRAIIEGFRGKARYEDLGINRQEPYRIFFSDPKIISHDPRPPDDPNSGASSSSSAGPIGQIWRAPELKPTDRDGDLFYKMYKLKSIWHPNDRRTYGSILFYYDEDRKVCNEIINDDDWEEIIWQDPRYYTPLK